MKRLLMLILMGTAILGLSAQNAAPEKQEQNSRQQLEQLLKLAAKGTANADLYYNLGVANYQTGNTGKAVLNFLRALNLDSSHRQAKQNLAYIQVLDPQMVKAPRQPFLLQMLLNLYDYLTLNRLAILLMILALLTTLCAHWLIHYPPEKERGLPILLLGCATVLFLIAGATLLVKDHRYRHNSKAVVMQGATQFYSAAESDRVLKQLPEGTVIVLRPGGGRRQQAILADGTRGWIERDRIEAVVPTNPQGSKQ